VAGTNDQALPPTAYAVLGLLSFAEELSGYDLRQWARSLRFFYWSPAQSQIYAELRRLAALGFVAERAVEQDGRPDKRLYRLTDAGRAELGRWQEETPPEPTVLKHAVALRLYFGHMARPERLRELLEEHARGAEAQMDALTALKDDLGDDPRWTFPALVAEWGLAYYAMERDTARALIARLPDAGAGPTPPRRGSPGPGAARRRGGTSP
jgi:DNA-binding PadR family transcriptional regulator